MDTDRTGRERVALYAGSFDPYTNGHHAIVKKAAALFDRVVVLLGVNVQKRRHYDAGAMAGAIREALAAEGLDNVAVVIHDGLVADFCAGHGIRYYVRGLRNGADYAGEEAVAQVNRLLAPSLETLYLRSDDPAVSSSMVRELLAFGSDVSAFVPRAVMKVIGMRQ